MGDYFLSDGTSVRAGDWRPVCGIVDITLSNRPSSDLFSLLALSNSAFASAVLPIKR